MGYPLSKVGVPPGDGVPPIQGWGTPPSKTGSGLPPSKAGLGTPPHPRLSQDPPTHPRLVRVPPRNVNRQTPVKTVPSRHTTYAGGNDKEV